MYYNGNSFQLFFSDFFNILFVTHTILDILIVLIVGFADKDIEYYSIQRLSVHLLTLVFISLLFFYTVCVNVFVDKLYQ